MRIVHTSKSSFSPKSKQESKNNNHETQQKSELQKQERIKSTNDKHEEKSNEPLNETLKQQLLSETLTTIRLENENHQLKQENNLFMLGNEILSQRLKSLNERLEERIQKLIQAVAGLQTVVVNERYERNEKREKGCECSYIDKVERLEDKMTSLKESVNGEAIGSDGMLNDEGELEEWNLIDKEFWDVDIIEEEEAEVETDGDRE